MVNPQADFIPSPVQITEMQVNGNLYADDYQLKSDSTLYLKSNENTITFRFTSLGYEKPELIKYEYKLQGKDSTWIALTNEDKVSYFDLPAGFHHWGGTYRPLYSDHGRGRGQRTSLYKNLFSYLYPVFYPVQSSVCRLHLHRCPASFLPVFLAFL